MAKYCSICGKEFEGYGNNASPVNNGECCNICNTLVVIPRRMQDYRNKQEKECEE